MKKYKLGEICTIVPGYAFKAADFGKGFNYVIKIKDIMPPYIDILHSEKVETVIDKKYEIKYGDFVMAMTGATIGKIGKLQIDSESKVYINQRVCKFIPEAFCDKEYLYYKLNTQEFQRFIYNNVDSKLAQPNIGHPTIYKYELELPLLSEQRRIGQFLKAIDDKINLNRAINHNLEAMAKQLYDYWFLQFNFPDENGKPYKSSGGKMVWNKKLKREIPEGWEVDIIQNIATTYSGGTPKSANKEYYKNGTIAWINSGELNSSIITQALNYITERGLNNSSAKLYPANTVLVAMYGATTGKVSLLTFEACSNQAVCGVIPNMKEMQHYVYLYLSSLYSHFINLSIGSARDNISQEIIKNMLLPIPSTDVILMFENKVKHVYKVIIEKKKQINTLTKLRDELLPLLMNGQASLQNCD